MSEERERPHEKHPWRENLEALAMAVIVALLFKYFILEISKIPSGSMQPTLMGDPKSGTFDRVLVDKLSYHFRDPKRWEIVVFKHPLERSRIMVKRLVGMPGEELKIERGDLWVRPGPEDPWHILRKPPEVQEEMWRALDEDDPVHSSWAPVPGSQAVPSGRDVRIASAGSARYRIGQHRIVDGYVDGYPDSLRDLVEIESPRQFAVADLKLEGEVEADADLERMAILLTEGTRTYRFEIPGPAAAEDARPDLVVTDDGRSTRSAAGDDVPFETSLPGRSPYRLEAGEATCFSAANLDDVLSLRIDGEEVLTLEIPTSLRQEASVTLQTVGGGADFMDLQVYRDIYYRSPHQSNPTWEAEIPEGNYVMLGDNAHNSADSRDWRAQTYEWRSPQGLVKVLGNLRIQNENPTAVNGPDGTAILRFKDQWGEVHWFPRSEAFPQLEYPVKLVPRHLIQGRALAVFWPIKPHKGLWRLTWLH